MNKVFLFCALLFFTTTQAQVTISTIKNPSTGFNTDTFSQSGYSELSYKVFTNTARALSIKFDVEATGAYSHYYNEYYSFNTETGKAITVAAIFKQKD